MKKLSLIILVILLFCFTLTGCTLDNKEVDDQVYTLVIGADKGMDNKIRLTVQYPDYKGVGGGGGGGMEKKGGGEGGKKDETGKVDGTVVSTVEAPSLLEAINLLNTFISRKISLMHTKEIVFSEDLAREGIGSYLAPIARFRETRGIMQIVVCKGTAEDFIKENGTFVGESVAKAMELMIVQSGNTGLYPRASFHDFYKGVLNPYERPYAVYAGINDFKKLKPESGEAKSPLKTQYELLPGDIPRKGEIKREFIGTAVFDGDRMVGSLNSYETRYFLMVIGEFQRGIITIEDKNEPGAAIPLDVRLGRKTKIKAHFENGIPVIDVKLNIEADLGAIQSRIPYERLSKIDDLNNQIKDLIQNGVKKTIEKAQKDLKSDIFGFGRKVARSFFTIQEFEDYNWLSHFPEAKVNVEVKVNVRRTGLMIGSSPIRYSNEKTITSGEE